MASWLSRLFFGTAGGALPVAAAATPVGTGIISPWQESSPLAKIAYSEIFGGGSDIVDRNAAMMVAPIKRGRAIIVGSISDLPVEAGRFEFDSATGETFQPIDRQPTWLSQTGTVMTPWHRMAMTIDDLIFHGFSLWALERTTAGTITRAARVPRQRWNMDQNSPTGIRVDDQNVTDPNSVILFVGPDEGVLALGADIVRGARAIESAWVGRVQNPIPAMVLHETEQNGATQEEVDEAIALWSAARTSPTGAVGYLPASLQMEVYGDTTADLFTEGRNNIRLDVANLLNLPASLLDGSTATASLTYVTQEGQRTALIDWLEYWIAPIEARLSMDDVCPHGQVIRFDRSNLTAVPNDTHGPEITSGEPDAPDATASPEPPVEGIAA